jgi:hypothetical protein
MASWSLCNRGSSAGFSAIMGAYVRQLGTHSFSYRAVYVRFSIALSCLALLNADPCFGIDYTFQADAYLQQNYNTNILLLPASLNPDAVWGSEMNLQTSLVAENPNWTVKGNARFDNWFYYPASGLNMQNQYIDGQYAYSTERSRFELGGGYISDAILASKTEQILGVVFGRVQRDMFNVMPSWTYSFSEYTKASLTYSYYNSKYGSNPLVSSVNTSPLYPSSSSNSLSTNLNHQVSEYFSVDGILSATAFVTQTSTIDYLNLTIGSKYAPRSNTEIVISGGGQYSQSITQITILGKNASLHNDLFNPLFNISIKQNFEYTAVILSYSQQNTPSINGNLFKSDYVSISANHRFSPQFNGGLRLSYNKISTPTQSRSSTSQNYYQVGGDLSYNLSENAVISSSYNFQAREIGANAGAYSEPQYGHVLSLNYHYIFDKLHY